MIRIFFVFLLSEYVKLGMRLFFRKLVYVYSDKTMNKGPVIYASNHQNAFMDALAIVFTQPRRASYFMTQAKVFQSKLGNAFFTYIYMHPIYRERDGLHTVKRNAEIFDQCVDELAKGELPLSIFPEGNHALRRMIRPLQKGVARIAFGVLDKYPDTDLKIIPVGINYSAHRRFRSDLFVFYGEPIYVKPFYAAYLKNKNQGYILLLAELDKRLRPLTINIPKSLSYRATTNAWVNNAHGTFDAEANFKANKKLIECIANDQPLPPRKVSDTPLIIKILFSPFGLYCYINTFISYTFVRKLANKLAVDRAFQSSLNLLFRVFITWIFYFLQALIVAYFFTNQIACIYFLSTPIINYFYLRIYKNALVIE